MKTIKFDISHKDKIVSGQWKVITGYEYPVEIVKWDCRGKYPILACISQDGIDNAAFYTEKGEGLNDDYLLIVTDISEEEELTELTLEAIRVAINSEQVPYEQRKIYSSKVLPYVEKLLHPSEIENYENSEDLTEFEIVVGKACEEAMKQMPSINPAIWAIGRQWTEKIYNAAKKQILGLYPAKQANDLGFEAGKTVYENGITEQETEAQE